MTPLQRLQASHKAAQDALAELYGPQPVNDETVDPDVLAYVLATTEGLEE
jgi:hypothetical protein